MALPVIIDSCQANSVPMEHTVIFDQEPYTPMPFKTLSRVVLPFLLFSLFGLQGCKKDDPCEGKVCFNGGTCVDGSCVCANGYSGSDCSVAPNACIGISCLNGGYCANGACVCPQGYTGADCSQQVTPSAVRINSITVTGFPATDTGGAGWDLTSGADLLCEVRLGSTVIWASPTFIQNANPSEDHTFTPNPVISLANPTSQYSLTLYDYDDFDANDWMGGVNFTPYYSSNDFPTTLVLAPAGSDVTFTVSVSYEW